MAKDLYDFTGSYGPGWEEGVLADRVADALDAGMVLHKLKNGKGMFFTGPRGGRAVPVVCGELIEVMTEDGPITGRCGRRVHDGAHACPGHWAGIVAWRDMDEAEKLAVEMAEEAF